MNRKLIPTLSIAAGMLLFQTGCSNITMLRIKELKETQAHIDSLRAELAAQQALIMQEQKSQNELMRLIRADMQVRFEDVSQKITNLEGSLSESKFKLSQIDRKTQEIQEQWKAKTSSDSAVATQKSSQVEKLFQIAYGDFTAGRFDLASNGFLDCMNQYPDAPLADDASYWYAECFYGKKDYDKAEQLYSEYIRKFRSGRKLCSALYKLGNVFEAKKQPEKRKMVWQKLIEGCPGSPEAASARDRLQK